MCVNQWPNDSVWCSSPYTKSSFIQTRLENLTKNDENIIQHSRTVSYYTENETNFSFIADKLTRYRESSEIKINL